MRSVKELRHLHESGQKRFGYVDITMYNCPPFVMFGNNNDCGICNAMMNGDPDSCEPGSTYVWSLLVPLATSVLDIGTRCGEYSLIAAALRPDVPIVSCEPNPDGFARLLINMTANDANNIIPKRLAAWNSPGFLKFGWTPKWLGHISSGGQIIDKTQGKAVTVAVETARLDDIVQDVAIGNRPVMKIDVEGAELAVFLGMPELLKKKPDIILETFGQAHCDAITDMTAPLGYRYYYIHELEKRLIPRDRLYPADQRLPNFNQLLTTRSRDEIDALMGENAA